MTNSKRTSSQIASKAAKTLRDSGASQIQRSLAASALRQASTSAQTGSEMEKKASKALNNKQSSKLTKEFAGTVLSQSNKSR